MQAHAPEIIAGSSHSAVRAPSGMPTPPSAGKPLESAPRCLLPEGESLPFSLWGDLLGMPYQMAGRGPDAYDCWGLLLEIFRRRAILIRDFSYSADGYTDDRTVLTIARLWKPCRMTGGAALMFRADNGGRHAGVSLDGDRYIHANDRERAVIVSHLSRDFSNSLIGAYEPL